MKSMEPHGIPPRHETNPDVPQAKINRRSVLRNVGAFVIGPTVAPHTLANENPAAKKESERLTFKDIENKVSDYIKALSFFRKLELVNELKLKAESILTLLSKDNGVRSPEVDRIAATSGTELKNVLMLYIQGIRRLAKEEEQEALKEVTALLVTVKSSSIIELSKKFS